MRVLAAVFPHARRVTLDIANVGGGFVKRGSEQQDQAVSFTDEIFFKRSQRDLYVIRGASAGDRCPGLRNRIDSGFRAFL